MSNSMQDDLKSILEKEGAAGAPSAQGAGSESAPVGDEATAAAIETVETPKEIRKPASLQDDLQSILKKTGNEAASELNDSGKENSANRDMRKMTSGIVEDPMEVHKAMSFAQQLQAARDRALREEKEFEKNLQAMQEQDPMLAKKIKLVGVGILALLLVFAAVILKNKQDAPAESVPASVQKESAAAVEESEYDKLKNAQDVNDKLRVETLDHIAEIAIVYHLEQKADLPVSAALVKLSEDNPVTEYLGEALVKYGSDAELLLDPKNPGYYYAYRSADGKNIELSARLENETGAYCQTGSSPCIYKKTITEAEAAEMSKDLQKYK